MSTLAAHRLRDKSSIREFLASCPPLDNAIRAQPTFEHKIRLGELMGFMVTQDTVDCISEVLQECSEGGR